MRQRSPTIDIIFRWAFRLQTFKSLLQVTTRRINPVTKFPEAYLPGYSKFGRIALTTSFVLFLVTTYLCA